jgi:acetolactate synthase-1/2/3 large subunit
MNGAESIIRTAQASGIEVCFANPGTTELPLVQALDGVPGIRAVLGLFEGVCTGAADGYARMLGKPAMVLLHLGPGLANGVANLHNARRAHSGMVLVVGEHATWHRPFDPPLAMDIEPLAKTVSGWQRTSGTPEGFGQDMADAVLAARAGKIAVLIVPYDLQKEGSREAAAPAHEPERTPVGAESVEAAARLLREGKRAALVLGGNHIGKKELLAAARISQVCGCTLMAENFPAHIERGAGLPGLMRVPYLPEAALDMLSRFDVFVFAGAREPVSFFGYEGIPACLLKESQKRLHLSGPGEDLYNALTALADALDAPENSDPGGFPAPGRPPVPAGPLNREKICSVIAALQPEGAIVVEEAVTSGFMYYPLTAGVPPFSLLTLTGGSLGLGAPAAAGAAIACPDRPVINFQADGAGLYTLQALWTEARQGLNVTTLICSNRSYDILKLELGRLGVSIPGRKASLLTDLAGIDWVSLGKGMGVPSTRASSAEDLAKELGSALREPGPHLIEMVM